MKTCLTYSDIEKILNQLIAENDPTNNELIAFYNKKLSDTRYKVIKKLLPKI